jgi:hypothetical protein
VGVLLIFLQLTSTFAQRCAITHRAFPLEPSLTVCLDRWCRVPNCEFVAVKIIWARGVLPGIYPSLFRASQLIIGRCVWRNLTGSRWSRCRGLSHAT